ncbi:mycothiol synthase [Nocardioides marmoriginsengisoli]|uniref:Mycothiol acetyltransferase n=1 Tax=Nocardioides marmoriginsengisoli TaxID=661483 RepID=A0A3N0CRP3_9ACTN|nr:mycothiol synthase [Nocardioides marmoriginsengisoli]RNL66070.1 mycothiol synthase [Nocardioides marmoriginsengisoli]
MSLARIDPDDFDSASGTGPAAEVRRIAEACDTADGVITLNEQACLQLQHRGLRDAALWLGDGGFALLHGQILDLAVHPEARNAGVGTALARAALATTDKVEAWSHGDHPSAGRIASRLGIPKERELRIMSRPTSLPVTPLPVPAGVRIRTFTPADEAALLEVNAAAFTHHPEQGHMTHEDFAERVASPWFDPAGLFLAVPEVPEPGQPEILGFHWTKVHRDENPPYGEVYVVATNPKAAGRGLGSVLTNIGLAHLATQGVDEVILYVDGDNDPAVALYERQGFTTVRTEVQYRGTTSGI